MDQKLIVLSTGVSLALAAGCLWLLALLDKVRENQDAFTDVIRRIGQHRRLQSIHKTDFTDR